jgi:hypothetical protein
MIYRDRFRAVVGAALGCLVLAWALSPRPAAAQEFSAELGRSSIAPAVVINATTLRQATQTGVLPAVRTVRRPLNGLTDFAYNAAKIRAGGRAVELHNAPVLPLPAEPNTGGVQTPSAGVIFDGNSEVACGNSGVDFTPADMALAVGDSTPSFPILQANNVCFSLFTKAGALAPGYPKTLASLVNLPSSTPISDPRALYDWLNRRYILAFIAGSDANFTTGTYWIAVSQTSDPAGNWFVYQLMPPAGSTVLPDFPRLGQDQQAVYLASNKFVNTGGTSFAYTGEEWLFLPKQVMYAGAGFNFNFIENPQNHGTLLDTTQPANVWDPADNPRAEFMVGSQNINFGGGSCSTSACNGLFVWAVANPLDTTGPGPEVTSITIPTTFSYSLPPSAGQPGGANTIDTNDTRISGEVSYGGGVLHAGLAAANGAGGAMAILYKIHPTLNANDPRCTGAFVNLCPQITAASITDESVITYGGSNSAYYPTTQPDVEGNATTVFNFSNSAVYASTIFMSRRVTQAAGSFPDGGFFARVGQGFYGQQRWGDYTAVAVAGLANAPYSPSMWFAAMYAGSDGNWRTVIGKNTYSAPNQP